MLDRLPIELLTEHILPRLPCPAVGALAQTCRHLSAVVQNDYTWHLIYEWRFGEPPTPMPRTDLEHSASQVDDTEENNCSSSSAKSVYIQRTDPLTSVAAFDTIIWLNGRYLDRVSCEQSPFGRVIDVKNVCWLDMHTRLLSVARGCYEVLWRVERAPSGCFGWANVPLVASPIDPVTGDTAAVDDACRLMLDHALRVKAESHPEENGSTAWRWVFGTELLRVRRPFSDVLLSIAEVHTGSWKSGIRFDCVALRRVSQDPDGAVREADSTARDAFLKRIMYPRTVSAAHHSETLLQQEQQQDEGQFPAPERAYGMRRDELTDEFDEFDDFERPNDISDDDLAPISDAEGAEMDDNGAEGHSGSLSEAVRADIEQLNANCILS